MTDTRKQQLKNALHCELQRLSSDLDPLDLVEDISAVEEFVEDFAHARVAAARASGATWATIAGRLGVTRQAAHKRFNRDKTRRRGEFIFELNLGRDKD